MCGNQMKQIHFGKGRPNIKIEFDMGDGHQEQLILHSCSATHVIIYSFLYLQRRQMSFPDYLRSRMNSLDLHLHI